MAWPTINRLQTPDEAPTQPFPEALKEKIRSFFPRYETKRAALLPALHLTQETYGYISWQAMREIAELLEIKPADVFDTVTFYTHFWTHPKGRKVVTVCRSLSCELMGGREVLEAVKKHLGIDEHETTPDGEYSLVTEECLAGCDHAPCMLINERSYKCVKPDDIPRILADKNNDVIEPPRSDIYDGVEPPVEADDASAKKDSGTQESQEAD